MTLRSKDLNRNNSLAESQIWQLLFFAAILIIIFSVLFHTIYDIQYSGTGLFFDYASKIMQGSLPYRDFSLEYPPFALFFFLIPRLFTANYVTYAVLYGIEVFAFILIGLILVYQIALQRHLSPWKLMAVYTLGILAIGPITGQHYDIFPGVLVLLSIYYFWQEKQGLSWFLLALGTLTKIFPAAIAPLYLINYLYRRQYRQIGTGVLTFALTSLVILLPFLIISPASLFNLYNYHAERGIQIESMYSSVMLVLDKLNFISIHPTFAFGSWNVAGSVENFLAGISTILLVLALLALYAGIYRRLRVEKAQVTDIGSWSFMTVLVVLITSKILSPQYLIWLIPLLPLVSGRFRYAVWVIFVVMGGLTYYIFPHAYLKLIDFNTLPVIALLGRNLLLVAMLVLVWFSADRKLPELKE